VACDGKQAEVWDQGWKGEDGWVRGVEQCGLCTWSTVGDSSCLTNAMQRGWCHGSIGGDTWGPCSQLGWVGYYNGVSGYHALLVAWWCEKGIDGIWVRFGCVMVLKRIGFEGDLLRCFFPQRQVPTSCEIQFSQQ